MTICAPTSSHGTLAGSFSAKTRNSSPPTLIVFSVCEISCSRLPRIESYLSKCASVLVSVRSLTATKSISLSPSAVRSTLRPIRPKPLIPTLIAMILLLLNVLGLTHHQATDPEPHSERLEVEQGIVANQRCQPDVRERPPRRARRNRPRTYRTFSYQTAKYAEHAKSIPFRV